MAVSSIVLLIFCATLLRPLSAEDDVSLDGNKEVDGRSVPSWLGGAFKKAIGTLSDATGKKAQLTMSDRQAPYQDTHPQMARPAHYWRAHVMPAPAHPNAAKRGPSHPPRPVLFGGFQPVPNGIPMRPRHHPSATMASKPGHHTSQWLHQHQHMARMPLQQEQHGHQQQQEQNHQQHGHQQQQEHGHQQQQQYGHQQQQQHGHQQQQQHGHQQQQQHGHQQQQQHGHQQQQEQQQYHNQQARPIVRNLAPRPEQPHAQQSQQQHHHHPYPIELIELPPPPVPPPSYAQQELLKLRFNGEEYLTYLYLNPPAFKEPDQDIQAAQSWQNRVTQDVSPVANNDSQPFHPVADPSPAIYDPYRSNSVHSVTDMWEKNDKQSLDDDWTPIPSPWHNQTENIPVNTSH